MQGIEGIGGWNVLDQLAPRRGLRTGAGPAAVGDATTQSVVTSIFLIVVLDAIFAVVYYNIDF